MSDAKRNGMLCILRMNVARRTWQAVSLQPSVSVVFQHHPRKGTTKRIWTGCKRCEACDKEGLLPPKPSKSEHESKLDLYISLEEICIFTLDWCNEALQYINRGGKYINQGEKYIDRSSIYAERRGK